MKRIITTLAAVLLAVGVATTAGAAKKTFIAIGTGGPTGVYFATGNAICRLVHKTAAEGRKKGRKHGIRCSAPSTGGSNYNISQIKAGELDLADQSDSVLHRAQREGLLAMDRRPAEAGLGRRQHQVVAAFGVQRHPRAQPPGQTPRPGPGGQHDDLGLDLPAGCGPQAVESGIGLGARSGAGINPGNLVDAQAAALPQEIRPRGIVAVTEFDPFENGQLDVRKG